MGEPPTKVDVRDLDRARVLRLPRRLGADTEDALAPAVAQVLDRPLPFLVIDFSGVQNTDSAGIGLLFDLLQRARAAKIAVALAGVTGQPRMVLERVRLDRHVPIHDTVDDALRAGPPETA